MAKLEFQNRGYFRNYACCLALVCLVAAALLTVRVSAPTFEDCHVGHSSVPPSTSHTQNASFCSLSEVDSGPPLAVFRLLPCAVGVESVLSILTLYPDAAHNRRFYSPPPP